MVAVMVTNFRGIASPTEFRSSPGGIMLPADVLRMVFEAPAEVC